MIIAYHIKSFDYTSALIAAHGDCGRRPKSRRRRFRLFLSVEFFPGADKGAVRFKLAIACIGQFTGRRALAYLDFRDQVTADKSEPREPGLR